MNTLVTQYAVTAVPESECFLSSRDSFGEWSDELSEVPRQLLGYVPNRLSDYHLGVALA